MGFATTQARRADGSSTKEEIPTLNFEVRRFFVCTHPLRQKRREECVRVTGGRRRLPGCAALPTGRLAADYKPPPKGRPGAVPA
jgi:hypothetical protein